MVDSNFFRVLVILLLTAALLFFKLIILVLTVWVLRAESKGRPPSAIPFGQIHTKLPNSTPLLRFARSISLPRIRKMLPILQFNNICSFFTIIYFTRSASFDKAKFLQDESHVLTSGLQRLWLSSSYHGYVMSNPIKDRKLLFCGGNNFSMQSRYVLTSVQFLYSLALFTININYVLTTWPAPRCHRYPKRHLFESHSSLIFFIQAFISQLLNLCI